VVRCEFEREGIVVPPEGRFMGKPVDFCMHIFDYRSYSSDEIARKCRREPRLLHLSSSMEENQLIGPEQTGCFAVRSLHVSGRSRISGHGKLLLLLATEGEGYIETKECEIPLRRASRWIVPAATEEVVLAPRPGTSLDVIACFPGASETPLTVSTQLL